jgi:hypothetical protein
MPAAAADAEAAQPEPESVPETASIRHQAPRRIQKMDIGPSIDIATAPSGARNACRCSLCGQSVDENELRCGNCGTRVTRPGPGAATKPAAKRASIPKDKTKRGAKGPKRRQKGKAGRAAQAAPLQHPERTTDTDAEIVGYFREALVADVTDDATIGEEETLAEAHALCVLDELASRATWPESADSWAVLLDDVLGVGDETWVTVLADSLALGLQARATSVGGTVQRHDNAWEEVPSAGVVVGPGTTGLAVLSDDGEWRWCVALQLDTRRRDLGEDHLLVKFTESMGLGKQQWVGESTFRPEWTVACADDDEGQCAMCRRVMPLTFHHLIPKEAVDWVLSHGLPKDQMPLTCPSGQLTKEFLAQHGILCCRQCHSSIHRSEDNRTLAR